MIGVRASYDFLSAVCTLLGGRRGAIPEEVAVQDPVEEHRVHAEDDRDARAGHGQQEQRQGVLVDGEPARHPSEQHYPEEDEGADVEQGHVPVGRRVPRLTDHDEELPDVQEDGVDLHDEREGGEGEQGAGVRAHAEAGDGADVVNEQLVGVLLTVFLVVEVHVEKVVDEVAHAEGDEHVGGVVKGEGHVGAHLGVEVKPEGGPDRRDGGVYERRRDVAPLPCSLR